MTAPNPAATAWKIDPAHSVAEFKVRHMMISNVRGRFAGVTGSLTYDPVDPTVSIVEASIPVSGLSTGDDQRDGHLRSADFFDAEKFPALAFKSTAVRITGSGELAVTGDLAMHGVTKAVTFAVEGPTPPAKDPWGNLRIGLSASAKINRKDFGLVWNTALESGGVLVGDEVAISLDIQLIKG